MNLVPHHSSHDAAPALPHRRRAIAACIALALLAGPVYAAPATCDRPNVSNVNGTGVGCGDGAVATGSGAVAVGYMSKAIGDNAIALGNAAQAFAGNSLALGTGAVVNAAATGSIALGAGSVASGTTLATPAYLTGQTAPSELAIGGRRITGVADGANNDDAATVGQLKAANVGNDLAVRYAWNDANGNKTVDAGEIDYSRVILGADPKTGVPIGGGVKVSNVMAGAVAQNSMEAVNGGQLHAISKSVADALGGTSSVGANGVVSAGLSVDGTTYGTVASALDAVNLTANKGWYVQSNGTTGKIAPGDTLNVVNGSNTTAAYNATTNALTVGVVDAPVFGGMVTANGGLTVANGQTVSMGDNVVTGVAEGSIAAGSEDAVNGGQLYTIHQQVLQQGSTTALAFGGGSSYDAMTGAISAPSYALANANAIGGSSGPATDVGSGFAKVDEALGAINTTANKGFNISADGGATRQNIAPGGTVAFAVGSNATVSRTGDTITYGVVPNPTFTGMVTASGGLSMAGNRITNVADGEDSTDAVNKGQLDAIAASAGLGWNLQANGGTSDNIAGGGTVNIADGLNTAVTYDAATNTLQVGVVDAPTFSGTVTANGGLAVGSGQVVDMGGNVVTNVAAGTVNAASTAAVNGSQLFGVSQSFANVLGGGSTVNADGTISLPSYALTNANTIAGSTGAADNAGDGFSKVDNALGVLQANITDITSGSAGIRYFHVNSTADDSVATGGHAIAIGPEALATQGETVALGHGAHAINGAATALGSGAWAYGYQSTAVGYFADTRGDYSSAFGSALAFGRGTTALGAWASAAGDFDWTGAGGARPGNIVEIVNGTAVGFSSVAAADDATAVGAEAEARGLGSLALGRGANASAEGAVAIGQNAVATLPGSIALGSGSTTANVVGTAGTMINGAMYDYAGAAPVGTVSVGSVGSERTITNVAAGRVEASSTDAVNGSQLYATNQAIQSIGSMAGNANDLAVKYAWSDTNGDGVATSDEIDYGTVVLSGEQGTRIGNLAPGLVSAGSMDAINGSQLFAGMTQVANYFGGGAAMTPQGLTAPDYLVLGQSYSNVGDALQALDQGVTLLDARMTLISNRPVGSQLAGYTHGQSSSDYPVYGDGGPGSTALGVNAHADGVEDAVAVGESATVTANYGTAVGQGASATADNAVALGHGAVADRADTVSVGTVGGERQVVNVADATQDTDAVNKRQLDRGVASANGYTDARVNALTDSFEVFQGNVDQRLRKQDQRIDRQGAMSAAMMNMAVSAAGIHTPNRVGVGVGFQGGESALSLGYQRAFSDRATITFGGAFSSDDQAVGIGAGFGW